MFDINRARAICEAATMLHNKRGYFNTAAACDFAEKAVVGWPAALDEIERLREALEMWRTAWRTACDDEGAGLELATKALEATNSALGESKE